jgi:DMSO/TMAO reductase YedYZ molybdopterin-dependent catalytic subunit
MGKLNEGYIKAKELVAKKFGAQQNHETFDEHVQKEINRLPPGQRLVTNFPVLDLGYQPMFFEKKYRFVVDGEVENPISLTWEEVKNLPKTELTSDFHCVTKWSKFDVKWGGVSMKDILALVKPKSDAKFVMQYGLDTYTTNVPLEALMKENVILAYELDGQPLPKEHGGPMRMIIPDLYAWKGSKFITRIEFLQKDKHGFWEDKGYSNTARPWNEERYS